MLCPVVGSDTRAGVNLRRSRRVGRARSAIEGSALVTELQLAWQRKLPRNVAPQPRLELGCRAQTKRGAKIKSIMKRRALILEHDIIGAWNAHDVVDPRRAQQREQRIHVVLIGFRVIRIADVAAHRQPQQLAAEMIFKSRAQNLLSVIKILRPDKAYDGVDE